MSNIFRADNSCAHQIRNGLLIGTVAFLIPAPPLSELRPAGLQSPDPNSRRYKVLKKRSLSLYILLEFLRRAFDTYCPGPRSVALEGMRKL
jgi:hypothetical protein